MLVTGQARAMVIAGFASLTSPLGCGSTSCDGTGCYEVVTITVPAAPSGE